MRSYHQINTDVIKDQVWPEWVGNHILFRRAGRYTEDELRQLFPITAHMKTKVCYRNKRLSRTNPEFFTKRQLANTVPP